jgi:hypothetical protein
MLSRTCGCDYKKIHTGLVASSGDDGAAIIEVHTAPLPDFGIQPASSDVSLSLHQPGVIGGPKMKSYLMETDIGAAYAAQVSHARR